jgi:hypothetical protein
MSKSTRMPLHASRGTRARTDDASPESAQAACPVCGALTEARQIGDRRGWACLNGGYAHYYQARYGHLKRWFTSGEGNLREPVIDAMNCAA